MEYISLYKLFFKEPDSYENIYMDKINNEFSIKFRFQIHDYPAFYISNNEMMCLINEIQQYNKKIITMVHGNIPEIAYT